MTNRTRSERTEAAVRRLQTEPNVWVATASMSGVPHLVPLSLAWDGEAVIVATPTDTPTVRNAIASGVARATLDSADDVVIIDADVRVDDIVDVEPSKVDGYISRVGWDPREQSGTWSLLTLTPRRIQSWNGVGEIDGRTIMRNRTWVAD
jgi:hypothetical protein